MVGSTGFVERLQQLLGDRTAGSDAARWKPLPPRPPLVEIVAAVATHFGSDPTRWAPGRRSFGAGRAVAAYLARRHFGYSAGEVAETLGYRSHGSVRNALGRVEAAGHELQDALAKLRETLDQRLLPLRLVMQ
jgi:hypothetical protein